MMFTDAVCRAKSKTRVHWLLVSRQIKTLPSYEEDARMLPYLGCAQEIDHTAPSCLRFVSRALGVIEGE